MPKIALVFVALLATFFTSWSVRAKTPVGRPDNLDTGGTTPWYAKSYTAPIPDQKWVLDPEIPVNYIPVPGEDDLYMIIDDAGKISGYRKRVPDGNGGYLWEEANPDIPEEYDPVADLPGVFSVTYPDGTNEYLEYVRNEDGSFGFLPVDKDGTPLDVGTDATLIGDDYIHLSDNIYGFYDENGVLLGYRQRAKNGDGFIWQLSDAPSGYSQVGGYAGGISVPSTPTQNQVATPGEYIPKESHSDGTYTETQEQINTVTENGERIMYRTLIYSTYDAEGNLLSTKKEGPYEISREKLDSATETPDPSRIEATLDAELTRVASPLTFDTIKAQEVYAKLNAQRAASGISQLAADTSGDLYKLALLRASDMATYDYINTTSPMYGTLQEMAARFGYQGGVAENIWKVSSVDAETIHLRFQSDEGSRALRMGTNFTKVAIAIVEKNGQSYIAEVFG